MYCDLPTYTGDLSIVSATFDLMMMMMMTQIGIQNLDFCGDEPQCQIVDSFRRVCGEGFGRKM